MLWINCFFLNRRISQYSFQIIFRLWFKTNTKLGKVFLERGDFFKLSGIIKELKNSCKFEENDLDPHMGELVIH